MTAQNFLVEHLPYLSSPVSVPVASIQAGQIVQFFYHGEKKTALILNPLWKQKVHAISLSSLPRLELTSLIRHLSQARGDSQRFYEQYVKRNRHHPYRTYLYNDILNLQILSYQL